MTKYDLCTGDIVLSTKGSYGIVLRDTGYSKFDSQIKWYCNNKGQVIDKFRSLSMVNEDLTFKHDLDNRIVKVWRTKDKHYLGDKAIIKNNEEKMKAHGFECIYEELVKEVTMAEVEEKFGCKVKIIKENN